jgi:hypothetical protein
MVKVTGPSSFAPQAASARDMTTRMDNTTRVMRVFFISFSPQQEYFVRHANPWRNF